jgi:membrane fusion protein (multidrug efflux system)
MTSEKHAEHTATEPAAPRDDLGFDLPAPAVLTRSRALVIGATALVLLGAAFASVYVPGRAARASLEASTLSAERGDLRVEVVVPKAGASDRAIVLPGSVQPLEETTLYARASGFTRRWLVDIGDKVTEGQLLAEIETPELDQEQAQARAQLAQAAASVLQASANRDFSKTNLARYVGLTKEGLASQQDLDQKRAQAEVDEANVNVAAAAVSAQHANLQRLAQLKSFARVTAPFAGTVTARWIERGALVSPGTATPLFKIAALDPVRVFIQVPQDVAPSVRAEVPAKVTIREYAGRAFDGRVVRSAGALDAATRTMNTEVRVPNPRGELMAGMYAQVALTLPSSHRVFEVPVTALQSDARGTRVAVVDAAGKVKLVPVVVERDTGTAVEVSSGLDGTERVVKLASAELADGKAVVVLP